MNTINVRSFSLASLAVSVSAATLMGVTGVVKADPPANCYLGPCHFLALVHPYGIIPPFTTFVDSYCFQPNFYSCGCYHPEGLAGPYGNWAYEVLEENPYQCNYMP